MSPIEKSGIVYGGSSETGPVYKWKSLVRNSRGKRDVAFLHGAGGWLVFRHTEQNAPLVLVAGEEKALAAGLAGFNVVCGLTGEKSISEEQAQEIAAAGPIQIILANDHDADGNKANTESARILQFAGCPAERIRIVSWPENEESGADLNDILKASGAVGLKEFLQSAVPCPSVLPETLSAATLQQMEFAPPRFIVAEIRPEGLSVIASKPKKGKTWIEYDIAIRVATGTAALGRFQTFQGEVLYLSLEDSPARTKLRMAKLIGDAQPWPDNLHFAHEWSRLDKGGFESLRVWLRQHPQAALIVIDTFQKIRPPQRSKCRDLRTRL